MNGKNYVSKSSILQAVRSMKITLMGLENSGKTTSFHHYLRLINPDYDPTVGRIVESIQVGDIGVTIRVLGGKKQFRRFWEHYTLDSKGIIFFIDMNAPADFPNVREVLATILSYKHLQHIPIAIFLNKIDLISQQRSELVEKLNLNALLKDRFYKHFFTSAKTGHNIKKGFEWIFSKSEPHVHYIIPQIPSMIDNKSLKNKIIFMSLPCAGQATICKRIMDENWMPSKDDKYLPTIDYERYKKEVLGTEFTLFNLGGQTAFLDRFTTELSEFIFTGMCAYIFTMDPFDIKQVMVAKYYFDISLKKINQYSPKSSVFLFIHKQDLLPKSLKDEVNQTIKDCMLAGVSRSVGVFQTTIYNNSIFQAMDAVFRKHIQIYEEDQLVVTPEEDNDEDDDMFSLSLREALKILRDEDEE